VFCSYAAYFLDIPLNDMVHLPVPLNTVFELTPSAYGCTKREVSLDAVVPSLSLVHEADETDEGDVGDEDLERYHD
jgi:hypothetical protein